MSTPRMVLLAGPAGTGKSTLAVSWAQRRPAAAVVDLGAVRECIRGGALDPQEVNPAQQVQYAHCVAACLALAQCFLDQGYDAVITDVLDRDSWESAWLPRLDDRPHTLVRLTADLPTTLERAGARAKRVRPDLVRHQHRQAWPEGPVLDTTGLGVGQATVALERLVG